MLGTLHNLSLLRARNQVSRLFAMRMVDGIFEAMVRRARARLRAAQ